MCSVRSRDGASSISTWSSATESAPPDTATKTRSPPASIAWRRIVSAARTTSGLAALESDPHLSVFEVLLLPHGHRALQRVDRVLAGGERLPAMRGRHGDEHARLPDL